MKNCISILLPTYNCRCVELVENLHRQCEQTARSFSQSEKYGYFNYEIIVADDGSPEKQFIAQNKAIEALENVRYIIRANNSGRSRIRNFLASEAKYDWLLFIDGDLSLDNPDYIYNYVNTEGDNVVVGGITIGGNKKLYGSNLRWLYEKDCESAHTLEKRKIQGGKELHTNFCILKSVMENHPFDEQFSRYGYEDVLLGKALSDDGIQFLHIDNPVLFSDFEENTHFLAKTEEGLQTLAEFKDKLKGYSRMMNIVENLQKKHLLGVFHTLYKVFHTPLKNNLKGNKPSIFVFNIYKLLYLSHIFSTNNVDNYVDK